MSRCGADTGCANLHKPGLSNRRKQTFVALVDGEVHVVAVVRADGDVGDEGVELGEKDAPSGDARHVRLESDGAEEINDFLKDRAEDFDSDGLLASLLFESSY